MEALQIAMEGDGELDCGKVEDYETGLCHDRDAAVGTGELKNLTLGAWLADEALKVRPGFVLPWSSDVLADRMKSGFERSRGAVDCC